MGYYDDLIIINVNESKDKLEPSPSTKHGHKYYGLIFLHKGGMILSMDGKDHVLKAPCAFWHAGKISRYKSLPDLPRDQIWASFLGGRGLRMAQELTRRIPEPFIPITRPSQYYELFLEMKSLFLRHNSEDHYRMVILLERLIGLTIDESIRRHSEAVGFPEKIRKLGSDIMKNPIQEWDFKNEAAKLCISYSGFRTKFRIIHGSPPYEFLLKCRMIHAASILRESGLSVKEAADKCRFDDVSSFSRLFRKKMGVPPSSYKYITSI